MRNVIELAFPNLNDFNQLLHSYPEINKPASISSVFKKFEKDLSEFAEKYPELKEYSVSRPSRGFNDIFEKLQRELLESGLNSVVRSWDLIQDQTDIIIFVSGTRAEQINAAKRLAKQLVRPPLPRLAVRHKATRVGMPEEQFVDEILFPEGLMVAMAEMHGWKTVRLGRKWLVDENGRIQKLRPVYDITVGHFLRWLHQESGQACYSILLDLPYPNHDALAWCGLDTEVEPRGDGHSDNREKNDEEARVELDKVEEARFRLLGKTRVLNGGTRRPLITGDEENATRDAVINLHGAEQAKKIVSFLRQEVSPKERELIDEALRRDGELVTLLQERGYGDAAIRKKRERFRARLSK